MPKYVPLEIGTPLQASASDLIAFNWRDTGISADFLLPHDGKHVLRVSFGRPCIVRLLDEMPLSTEQDVSPALGLVPEHFAYRVEGAIFAQAQSEAWKQVSQSVEHYRFVTGNACMDVLSGGTPSFSVIANSMAADHQVD